AADGFLLWGDSQVFKGAGVPGIHLGVPDVGAFWDCRRGAGRDFRECADGMSAVSARHVSRFNHYSKRLSRSRGLKFLGLGNFPVATGGDRYRRLHVLHPITEFNVAWAAAISSRGRSAPVRRINGTFR